MLWIESAVASERQQVSAGNLIFAGEHLSDAYYGFMNGGAQTGRLAAGLVLKKMAAVDSASLLTAIRICRILTNYEPE